MLISKRTVFKIAKPRDKYTHTHKHTHTHQDHTHFAASSSVLSHGTFADIGSNNGRNRTVKKVLFRIYLLSC